MLLEHWSDVGRSRIGVRGPDDWFAYNVCTVSAADYERVRALLRDPFREIRSLLARSAGDESVALLNLQWIELTSRR